jgi:deazaflavin-dependent oxidoreductase (nitroreductase family)
MLRRVLHAPVHLYHAGLGFLLGHRFLLLVHSGRRSGRRYEAVVEVMRWDPAAREAVVMSGWGRGANWFRNVEAGGAVEIAIGRERWPRPEHRVLSDDEAAAVLAGYERRNRLAAPLVRRVLGRLSGTPYDGSPEARLAVVRALPLLAFTPRRP